MKTNLQRKDSIFSIWRVVALKNSGDERFQAIISDPAAPSSS